MDLSNWAMEFQQKLREEAAMIATLGAEELAIRIAVAIQTQDSCGECRATTMRWILMTGASGLYTCDSCTEEMK